MAATRNARVDPGPDCWCRPPAEDQASTVAYRVTVQATDDGEPPLTSQSTYSIHVLPSNAVPASDPMGAFGTTMSWSQSRFATRRFYRVVQL